MHIRGWTILAVSIFSLLILLYLAYLLRRVHKSVHQLDLTSDKSAMAEAVSAHQRIDRLDQNMKDDQGEVSLLRQIINAVKGQVQFMLHKDISTELTRQADAANDAAKEKERRRQDDDGN